MKINNKLLGIPIRGQKTNCVLEKVQRCISTECAFCHIVSLNPEIIVMAQKDREYMNILSESDIQICDGVGIALGGSILGIDVGDRLAGSDLMEIILQNQSSGGLRVLLLGGEAEVAEKLAICYQKKYPTLTFRGIMGISDILNQTKEEEDRILSIVADYKPQILFVALGSPWQEKWIWRHKNDLKGVVCMGVGGGFDFAIGAVKRAPQIIRAMGFEWLFRLIYQPWRIRRQTRLIEFIWLVFKQKIGQHRSKYEKAI